MDLNKLFARLLNKDEGIQQGGRRCTPNKGSNSHIIFYELIKKQYSGGDALGDKFIQEFKKAYSTRETNIRDDIDKKYTEQIETIIESIKPIESN